MYDKNMDLALKNKIYRLFILGFEGSELAKNPNLQYALKNNLGGVIFFTQNIESEDSIIKLISDIKSIALQRQEPIIKTGLCPVWLAIDQEGGRVERTEQIHGGKKYLSAKFIAEKGEEAAKAQTQEIARELRKYGFNMNFAPVYDVNTNDANPIIGERAYSSEPDAVAKYANLAAKTYLENGIIPVAKHFPGHGDTDQDSHLTLPVVDMDFQMLEKLHIAPFISAIEAGIPAIMAAHVYYPCFEAQPLPASLSKKILGDYLTDKLGYRGLILSDDMVMGGTLGFEPLDALIRGVEAGINMFIYRNSNDTTIDLIEALATEVSKSRFLQQKVDYSCDKIYRIKTAPNCTTNL